MDGHAVSIGLSVPRSGAVCSYAACTRMNCAFARLRVRSAVVFSRETRRLSLSARLQLLLHPINQASYQRDLYLPRRRVVASLTAATMTKDLERPRRTS